MGGRKEPKKSWWRIDSWGHGVYIKNVKANLLLARKWKRFVSRRSWIKDYWKLKGYEIDARITSKLIINDWRHFERFTTRREDSGVIIDGSNGRKIACRIHRIFTISTADVVVSNDETNARAKRVINGKSEITENYRRWWWLEWWWLYGVVEVNEDNG